ncbi:hypothetical protein SAY86_016717 [Trapa natans]|uniref:RRM domain-containing protein n=1 Tax=Trapa natans TaxID=22666 RepID=A0AAN7R043_TRANT|nr:hypothetical protein SAY86_016717 [Trapa natans]
MESPFLNSPFGDTTYTKVFVGGLAWQTRSDSLRQHFEQFGDVLEAVVISDKHTGRSKGYGFVTFRDPEAARRACADPTPIVDGRQANCNLASLGRTHPLTSFVGRPRQVPHNFGCTPPVRGAHVGSFGYQQQPISYGYHQQRYLHPPYGYAAYGPEYAYPQGMYSPFMAQQQYLRVYGGVPGNANSAAYPYGRPSQNVPPSGHGYMMLQGYPVPGHQTMQFAPRSGTAGAVPPSQQQFTLPAPVPPYMQGGGSAHTSG